MEKNIPKWFVERILSAPFVMELNKRERTTIKGKNMFKVVKEIDEIQSIASQAKLEKNIFISTHSNEHLIRQNIDGTLSLILNRDENLSVGKSAFGGNMSVFEYWPQIKMCIPQGLKIHINRPSFSFNFFDKIYPSCKIYYPDHKDSDSKDTAFVDLPERFIMTDFYITFYIDLHRLKDINKTFLLKKGQTLANIFFTELPHFRDFGGELINIYHIMDDEIFKTFIDTF